jgi:hypothetical protein
MPVVRIASVLAALAAVSGCQGEPSSGASPRRDASVNDGSPGIDATGCATEGVPLDIDLLFVVGNGARSGDAQAALLEGLASMFARIDCDLGVRPDLHVGVVSTDLGAGGFDIPNCNGSDGGDLVSAPALAPDCPAPDGAFVRDFSLVADLRDTNYEGSLAGAVGCIAALGTGGCVFEQPLASALAATDPANLDNEGFVRDGALLAVVFIGGGDDCSAADGDLFDPNAVASLGPLDPFRCFESGVECVPDDPRAVGVKDDCAPRETDTLLVDPRQAAADLVARKGDPADVLLANVSGIEPQVVVVDSGGGGRDVGSSCAPSPDVDPPIRTGAAISSQGGFEDHICREIGDVFDSLGARIAAAAAARQSTSASSQGR